MFEADFYLWQEGLKVGFMKVTSRSIKYFGFLVGGVNGSRVDFQWAEGRHKMWGVILRSGHHPKMGFKSQNNLCRHLLVGNEPWAAVFF